MKKSAILIAVVCSALLATSASASKRLAREVIDLTYPGEFHPAPYVGHGVDPARREGHFRRVAAGFYAKRFNEEELTDLVGFYRSGPGARFIKTDEKLEREILAVAFTTLVAPSNPAPAVEEDDTDPRRALVEQLMETALFRARIVKHAANLDKIRADSPVKKGSDEASGDGIRRIYVDRYSTRFSKRMLIELVAFHKSKLGLKFARSLPELEAHLRTEANRYQ